MTGMTRRWPRCSCADVTMWPRPTSRNIRTAGGRRFFRDRTFASSFLLTAEQSQKINFNQPARVARKT